MKNLELNKFNFYLQRPEKLFEIMGKSLLYAEVRPEGIFATENQKKREFSFIPLTNISARVESCPDDPNRYKAMNPHWLPWSQHRETVGQNHRVLLRAKLRSQNTQCVSNFF